MPVARRLRPAFGAPGIPPRWTRFAKDAIGTAYSASSRLWFTTAAGVVTELYYPSIDKPQVRDLQYLVTDGESVCENVVPLAQSSCDGGRLYHTSHSLLLAHEDKNYPGAIIASLSIPWGETKGDDDLGGYHLVWTRDMVQSALALLASDVRGRDRRRDRSRHSLRRRPVEPGRRGEIELTFYWTDLSRWEGTNYRVEITEATAR